MNVHVLGIDLGKNVCSIVGLDEAGAVVLRRRAKRETLIALERVRRIPIQMGFPTGRKNAILPA